MKTCRFCEGKNLVKVFDLGMMPLAGAFLKEEEFKDEKLYPLSLNFCKDCYLVQVNDIPPQQNELYKHTLFRSSSSDTVKAHFDILAQEIYNKFGICTILEIGCNDGVLLKALREHGICAIGIDPIVNEYFTGKCAFKLRQQFGQVDVIVSSYSFAHIDDMIDVMKGIKGLLKDSGILIIENYYFGNLLEHLQYDMIYHEHMSYFSFITLVKFLKRFDMEIYDADYDSRFRSGSVKLYIRNRGQGDGMISPTASLRIKQEEIRRYHNYKIFKGYAKKVQYTRKQLLTLLKRLKKQDKTIIGYGATGRGTVIMNYCGIDKRYLDYVIDDTPEKQGLYTPGMHVPIKAWDNEANPDYILLFSYAFADEIMKRHWNFKGKWIIPLPEVKVINGID